MCYKTWTTLKSNKIKCLAFDSFSQYGFYVLKCHSALD